MGDGRLFYCCSWRTVVMWRLFVIVVVAGLLAAGCGLVSGGTVKGEIILATTTSPQDSGLLDVLLPMFEKATGYKVKPIAVGSGQAMTMGERGEADVLLVHAPDSEETFMVAGHGTDRKLVMHNDFIVLGPTEDPSRKGR